MIMMINVIVAILLDIHIDIIHTWINTLSIQEHFTYFFPQNSTYWMVILCMNVHKSRFDKNILEFAHFILMLIYQEW